MTDLGPGDRRRQPHRHPILVSALAIAAPSPLPVHPLEMSLRAAAEDGEAAALAGRTADPRTHRRLVPGRRTRRARRGLLIAFPAPGLERTTGQIAAKAFPGGHSRRHGLPVRCPGRQHADRPHRGLRRRPPVELHVLGEGFDDVAPYAVMVLVLLVRPRRTLRGEGAARV
ncbi:hypothetical protein LV779_25875 [Streptomyces thinghirensis]|nr:hypothetical protein [Streptomyces thinghirensis]